MRPRIKVMAERSTEDKIVASKVYDVPYTIARKHYNKANGALVQAKFF
jgi:hypothetical protein